jgi:hypothetical protein
MFSRLASRLRVFFYRRKRAVIICGSAVIVLTIAALAGLGPLIETINHRALVRRFESLTYQDFLHDFDYMFNVLEENFPFFGAAESARGIDIRRLGKRQVFSRQNLRIYFLAGAD